MDKTSSPACPHGRVRVLLVGQLPSTVSSARPGVQPARGRGTADDSRNDVQCTSMYVLGAKYGVQYCTYVATIGRPMWMLLAVLSWLISSWMDGKVRKKHDRRWRELFVARRY